MASVRLANVAKSFGATHIIKGVTVDIRDGEFVALVGPSGSGKSTLLRMIAGLEAATGGVIEIDGRVVNDVPPKHRDVAMVFQNYALYPHMTVRQNLGFALRMRGAAKVEIDRCVDEAARSLNLEALLERYPRELSGGQRQRVATGRAIVRNPQVFLFDEPLSNLDAKLRVQVRAELRELHRRLGVTCIYVTHDQVEAMTMADRIVVLRDGRVEQVGAPLELYDHPANTFVATFIGSPAMNLLEGRYREGAVVLADGGALPVDPHAVPENAPLTIGIRPEHLDAVGPEEEGVDARVIALEPTGAETLITADLAGVVVTALTRRRVGWRAGDPIRLRPHPGRHLCFDASGAPAPRRADAAPAQS